MSDDERRSDDGRRGRSDRGSDRGGERGGDRGGRRNQQPFIEFRPERDDRIEMKIDGSSQAIKVAAMVASQIRNNRTAITEVNDKVGINKAMRGFATAKLFLSKDRLNFVILVDRPTKDENFLYFRTAPYNQVLDPVAKEDRKSREEVITLDLNKQTHENAATLAGILRNKRVPTIKAETEEEVVHAAQTLMILRRYMAPDHKDVSFKCDFFIEDKGTDNEVRQRMNIYLVPHEQNTIARLLDRRNDRGGSWDSRDRGRDDYRDRRDDRDRYDSRSYSGGYGGSSYGRRDRSRSPRDRSRSPRGRR